jgi:hypothetical protein
MGRCRPALASGPARFNPRVGPVCPVVDMLAMVLYLLRAVGLPGCGAGGAVAYNKRRGYGSTVYLPPLNGAAEHVHGLPRFCDSLSYGADALESVEKATGILDSQFHSGIPTLANSPVREAEDICRRCRRSCYLTGLLSPERLAHGWDIVRLGQPNLTPPGRGFS